MHWFSREPHWQSVTGVKSEQSSSLKLWNVTLLSNTNTKGDLYKRTSAHCNITQHLVSSSELWKRDEKSGLFYALSVWGGGLVAAGGPQLLCFRTSELVGYLKNEELLFLTAHFCFWMKIIVPRFSAALTVPRSAFTAIGCLWRSWLAVLRS